MRYCDQPMLNYQAEHIRKGECPVCHGKGRVHADDEVPCGHCGGDGKATSKDRERLETHDEGTCLICKLPHVGLHNPTTKYVPSGTNDCLDHLRQYVLELERRLAER